MTDIIGPGSTIGILGAGQLGRMLAISARQMGYRVAVFGGDRNSPCGQVSDLVWDAAFDDQDRLREFATAVDVVTYEFENVPAITASVVSARAPLRPGVALLETAQNRFKEKTALVGLGLNTARFRMVQSAQELKNAHNDFGRDVILKAVTDGYDGKGQWAIRQHNDIEQTFATAGLSEGIVEKRVDFEYELSIIAGRYEDGHCDFFEPILNHHANHILDVSVSGAPQVTPIITQHAQDIARSILEHFEVVGVLCVELFLTADGSLIVNEIAPRPHNSGHLTIEAYSCSQFELQLRTICNLPYGPLQPRFPAAAMANLLGQHLPRHWSVAALSGLGQPEAHLHLYGKQKSKENRKMGHVTVTGTDPNTVETQAKQIRAGLTISTSHSTDPGGVCRR